MRVVSFPDDFSQSLARETTVHVCIDDHLLYYEGPAFSAAATWYWYSYRARANNETCHSFLTTDSIRKGITGKFGQLGRV